MKRNKLAQDALHTKCTQHRRKHDRKNLSSSSTNNNNNNKLAECFIHFSAGTNCKINYISFRCFFLVTLLCTQFADGISFVSFHCLLSSPRLIFNFICFFFFSVRIRTRVPFFLFISLLAVYHFHSLSLSSLPF